MLNTCLEGDVGGGGGVFSDRGWVNIVAVRGGVITIAAKDVCI